MDYKTINESIYNLKDLRIGTLDIWRSISETNRNIKHTTSEILTCKSYKNSESINEKVDVNKKENDDSNQDFPILKPDNQELVKRYAGKYIGIIENKLVAVDTNIRKLKEKAKKVMKKGQRCYIEYIDDGVSIYGLGI